MSFFLTIDTAVSGASICLADATGVIGFRENPEQKESAAWLQPAIRDLFLDSGIALRSLSVIAVSAGPGSYTGLRVGLATAKGLCYALGCHLVTVNTLEMMAAAALPATTLLCPMIDARRQEVFTAVYGPGLDEIVPTGSLVLNETSFDTVLDKGPISFFGNGSAKFRALTAHPNASFPDVTVNARHLVPFAMQALREQRFADLAYSEPQYGKAFFSPGFPPSA
ncbi:MAG: tsaB [Flaviaesturariibacter sp.]|nr:tsaB [Flaviaesturariibacter sp.]